MSVIVLPPRVAPPAVPAPVVGGSPWPGRLLALATVALTGLAVLIVGAGLVARLAAGMPYVDVVAFGLIAAPVVAPLLLRRRGGAR